MTGCVVDAALTGWTQTLSCHQFRSSEAPPWLCLIASPQSDSWVLYSTPGQDGNMNILDNQMNMEIVP